MVVSVLVPVVVILVAIVAGWIWYRRTVRSLAPTTTRPPSGTRLTSESLRRLPVPPWRVVYEIADDRLDGIDHVVVGPAGCLALRTRLDDRPPPTPRDDDPSAVARAALARGAADELAGSVGGRCDHTLVVYWGASRPDEPAAYEVVTGEWAVDGRRLIEAIVALPPAAAMPAQVDQVWQAVTTGIGRPDPLP